ncbi:MAG: beta galactosidase jelly roll domain-containing protein, partial [Bacteroidales bacterium]|nr:beta galactosidase jelly roll domain-containing protein [Bacteroidales bacterium]
MRKFLLLTLIVCILTACDGFVTEQTRLRESFNSGWKFSLGDIENAPYVNFNDSEWRALDLPHDWAIEGPFTQEVNYKGGYLPYPGVAWYRKTFKVRPETKNLMIECDGIMRNSKIWLNGEYIGGWPYGYTSFSIDLTDKIERENENIIAIRVDNQDNSSRWYPGSGIYRNVWLTYTNPIHVSHWGTYITTPVITENLAEVQVKTLINNSESYSAGLELSTVILDSNGDVLAKEAVDNISIDAEQQTEIVQQLKITDPQLWSVDSPYLYKAVTSIIFEGRVVDTYETPFGVRYFHFDPDKGFFLNGMHLKLKGVNLHHDLGPLGAAVNKRATERQLEIMKEMGVNAIRTAHNPPSPEQLELCDELGILVIDETFDEWSVSKYGVPNAYNIWFNEWAEKDTRALIMRDRNHPSVIMWSIGNEIPDLDTEAGKKHAKLLSDICREMDPTRPVN